jgi:hypothetical protein
MKRRSFIVVIVVILGGIVAWWFFRPASPSDKAAISAPQFGLDVSVSYSRPFKKGRVIFGEVSSGALQPYGQYWRLGANAATEITFNRNVTFGGKRVQAGTYRMYAIPGAHSWRVVLNSALGKSGAEMPDNNLDVVAVDVTPNEVNHATEQFTIDFEPAASGVVMKLKWDRTVVPVDVS